MFEIPVIIGIKFPVETPKESMNAYFSYFVLVFPVGRQKIFFDRRMMMAKNSTKSKKDEKQEAAARERELQKLGRQFPQASKVQLENAVATGQLENLVGGSK
ncbi:hypothetical protein A2410_01035 [Candidatus Shapirobacteria bacterium RIFOXYC1_FULL_38_24]|nr:MAG: hypothetical protein A2195_03250 [Candidatus Shapirobacteria bacterium RIFOXYA1_FULL_39_17]OGL56604.1 MAG: hypothetical protein A2410_01035 [Candidatus Shapirobacteria bacterium RIFOXYC1_FULL_38_24]